ncbi:MAG: tRNA uridine-5-carboxymethylaminomethyl(34) synthesis GTPase MnmE [Parasphingorhabdus sp.]
MSAGETIFALSSGQAPAAIGIIRISGAKASQSLIELTGNLPDPRIGSLRKITKPVSGELLDEALCLWFPGPHNATGEDLAEIHCHGGRAVIAAIEGALEQMDGLRKAEPGEFTRRAFQNGRMDLAEAEGLSDLLFAETELQRRAAVQSASGIVSRQIEGWQNQLLRISALVEAEIDFSDEDDVSASHVEEVQRLIGDLSLSFDNILSRPTVEKLRDGIRVVLGGPPNSGKSTLLNALVDRDAAIVSDIAGTTRDVIEVPIALGGTPFLFIDTAGIRDTGMEEIEAIGIQRARDQFEQADMILWLGPEGEGPTHNGLIEIASRNDSSDHIAKAEDTISLSPVTGAGMNELVALLVEEAAKILPKLDMVALNKRQSHLLKDANENLNHAKIQNDLLILAEYLRLARQPLDAITGKASTEDMLDALFGKFCIGK